ncbi:MAG: CRISPR-associated protein, Csh1 family [uncultured Sulfurovum sp.]|uniref:CRISPR-associated protein, Csh1 family n=1 Tax=uncultured Sulfurovum sp. TaxID=269237 RepID=A0A6S6UBN9_9BACT|nr:MAG: CRISPR-associated protein, Csh1 family [uncultured Sulfurovum sp.]
MVYDILEVFKEEYHKSGDKLILGKYELKEGIYIKVGNDSSFKAFMVKRKNRELIFTDIEGGLNSSAYEWLKPRDYYSEWLNANKAFFDKKIHNINYLSLFVKIESFISDDAKKRLNPNAIKEQYKSLCNYEKFKKPKEKEILKTFQEQLSDRERRKDIIKKYRWIENNIDSVVVLAKEHEVKNYIKIFFDEPIERYQEESEIYYAIKIFNDISFSQKIEDKVYGLSDSNMGLNSKKPYLEQKTRKEKAPFFIKKEDALLAKQFFDWLRFQNFMDKSPLGSDFFINRDFRDKALIIDFDHVPLKIDRLKGPIVIKNHLLIKKGKVLIEDERIVYLNILEDKVDEVLYNRQLKNNYYGEVYKKLDNKFAGFIYSTRDAMVDYFKKYDDRAFYQVIEKYTTHLAIEHLVRSRFLLAGLSLNIKFSLRKKGEDTMNIKEMQEKMIDRIEDADYTELSVEEFFYIAGQMARYLTTQSEAYQKNGDMLEAYLRANSASKLKRVIESEYFKYKHKISLGYVKFNNAMSLIMSYEGNEKLSLSKNMDSFLVGALSENVFYMKREG